MKNNYIKYFFLFFIIMLTITTNVNAESKYLYDVLKNEAESGGLAKEYTGEHHDSFTEEPSKKIYHWYAETDEDGNKVLEKNNAIFANYCWQMIRTTDTGGVKMIYNGIPNDGKCDNTGEKQQISKDKYNSFSSLPTGVGYMYNNNSLAITCKQYDSSHLYGSSATFRNGMYYLYNTRNSNADNTHHYTCNSKSSNCEIVKFYVRNQCYIELSNGKTINSILDDMFNSDNVNVKDSTIKSSIDLWYKNNLLDYSDKLDETIFCNDRIISNKGAWNSSGDLSGTLKYNQTNANSDLKCSRTKDSFSINNDEAKLQYSIGLATVSEMNLLGDSIIKKTGNKYWLMTPYSYQFDSATYSVKDNGELGAYTTWSQGIGVRPVISLKYNNKVLTGTGGKNTPYIIGNPSISNIILENDINKGSIINLNNKTDIEQFSTFTFNIIPKNGYYVKEVTIKDANNNDIEYIKNNNEYSFEMPDSDVTITPIYEKVKSSVNVEIINETEDFTVSIDDMSQVMYEEEVNFKVTPIKGYKVNNIRIVDTDGNEIVYNTTDNMNYTFVMPASDVTIIPSYERVSNSVSVDDNKNTKDFVIEVNDSKAVVYEDTVKFKIVPADGYEVEDIEIIDNNNNKIEYKKTDKDNEYSFYMPDTDVVIKPVYRKIETNKLEALVNPKTSNKIGILIFLLIIVSLITIFIRKKEFSSIKTFLVN